MITIASSTAAGTATKLSLADSLGAMPKPEVAQGQPPKNPGVPELVWMTPRRAEWFLSKNHPNQRELPRPTKELIKTDLRGGDFLLTHEAVAVSTLGNLIDGQTRLTAVVESGVPTWLWVFWDVPENTMGVVNCGKARGTEDYAKVRGLDWNRQFISVGLHIIYGTSGASNVKLTHTQRLKLITPHEQAVAFAVEITRDKNQTTSTSCFRAPLARAWYTQDHNLLAMFSRVVRSNEAERGPKKDSSATKLHSWIASKARSNSGRDRAEIYLKTERCLLAFLREEAIEKVYEAGEELFPVPGEPNYPNVPYVHFSPVSRKG